MPKKEAPLSSLKDFLPEAALSLVLEYIYLYKVHLTVTRERKTLLGDYRHAVDGKNHRISINGNLNKFSFLITLVHELAHLVTFMQHGRRVAAHGKEWKSIYRVFLLKFIEAGIFPDDIRLALENSLHNLPASSCADEGLMRVLRRYDEGNSDRLLIEQLPENALFTVEGGRVFRKGAKLRKRYQCKEILTGKLYLFSPVYEVQPHNNG